VCSARSPNSRGGYQVAVVVPTPRSISSVKVAEASDNLWVIQKG